MPLKYKIPMVGESFSEEELITYAESEGYEVKRIGNCEEGEMLLVLSESNMPTGMSFLLREKGGVAPYVRVY